MATTTVAPATLVPAPARVPIPYGLLSVMDLRPQGDGRWQSGVVWESPGCGPIGGIGAPSCDPETPTIGLPKELDDGHQINTADPFTVYADHTCSAMGSFNEAQDLANARLASFEEQRVEQAIWKGDLGNEPNFQQATVGSGGATSPHAVLAAMSRWISKNYGTAGVLHVGLDGAAVLKAEHLIAEKGGRWRTIYGDDVVIGTGYDEHGGGPTLGAAEGGFAWAVMTPPVFGYRSDVFTSSNRAGDLLDRSSNDLTAIAERTYLVGWEQGCVGGHGSVAYQMSLVGKVGTDGGGGGLTQEDLDAQTAAINAKTDEDRDSINAAINQQSVSMGNGFSDQTTTLQTSITDATAAANAHTDDAMQQQTQTLAENLTQVQGAIVDNDNANAAAIQANDDANTTTITDAIEAQGGGGA